MSIHNPMLKHIDSDTHTPLKNTKTRQLKSHVKWRCGVSHVSSHLFLFSCSLGTRSTVIVKVLLQTIKTTPQLRLCRNDQLPCANLWAPWYCESDSRECERDTGKKGSKKCHSVTLLLVKNFYWATSQHDPKATSTAEPIKLQGNKAVTVQKTLCGALWSPNTVTWYSLERNHTRN